MSDLTVKHSKANIYEYFLANKTRSTYTNIAISILLVVVFIFFALRPTILTVATIREKIKQYQDLNKKAEAKVEAGKKLQDQLNLTSTESPIGLKSEIEFMNKSFLSDYGLRPVFSNLVERAKQSKVVIRSIVPLYSGNQTSNNSFDTSGLAPSDKSYSVNFTVESKDLPSIENFIRSIEGFNNFPIFSRVKQVSISDEIQGAKLADTKASNAIPKVISATIDLTIYLDKSKFIEATSE